MLEAEKVERERSQHRDHREYEQESPLRRRVVRGYNLPWRIDDQPEDGGRGERPDQDAPAVVPGEDTVSANVVEGERERRQQRGDQAVGIEAEGRRRLAADNANR